MARNAAQEYLDGEDEDHAVTSGVNFT